MFGGGSLDSIGISILSLGRHVISGPHCLNSRLFHRPREQSFARLWLDTSCARVKLAAHLSTDLTLYVALFDSSQADSDSGWSLCCLGHNMIWIKLRWWWLWIGLPLTKDEERNAVFQRFPGFFEQSGKEALSLVLCSYWVPACRRAVLLVAFTWVISQDHYLRSGRFRQATIHPRTLVCGEAGTFATEHATTLSVLRGDRSHVASSGISCIQKYSPDTKHRQGGII